jgi:hypothetical protein
MSGSKHEALAANLARPLAFTLLMLYGLLSFLHGYDDWQTKHQFAPWVAWLLIIFGALLGSAAIRVIMRKRPAFGLSFVPLLGLIVLDLVAGLSQAENGIWKLQLGRVALSAGILWLVRRSDRALLPPDSS